MAHAIGLNSSPFGFAPVLGSIPGGTVGRSSWLATRGNEHRVTTAGSALYGHICLCCAGTDAAGDQRLEHPCPGHSG
jgi:hypothetical protein